ncbi:MAG: trehalose-phosphatase [Phycisphaerales bacterium]|nr:trehalose-phosphatase [Phycisphaerales bacterium]
MSRRGPENPSFSELVSAIARAARAPRLLVASDFDGTLAPLVGHPSLAVPNSLAVSALHRLCGMTGVYTAIISGRPRASLHALLADIGPELEIIGSHGAESPWAIDWHARDFDLDAARDIADDGARQLPGSWVEQKPAGIAWHFRACDPIAAGPILAQVRARFAHVRGGQVVPGLQVLECIPQGVSKAFAFEALRRQFAPGCSFFFGDDEPDADVFAALAPGDVGVAVGAPRPGAGWTVASPSDVACLLLQLADERERWNLSRSPR